MARYDAKDVVESYRDLFSERAQIRFGLVVLGVADVKCCSSKDPDLVGDERNSHLDGL